MRIYDGDRFDTSNKKSERFLTINACGLSAQTESRVIRKHGRVDHFLLYVESGKLSAILNENE